jgi:hypothetical protein
MNTIGLDESRAANEFVEAASVGEVSAIGITRIGGGEGVKFNLYTPPAADANLPKTMDGVPTCIEVVGPILKC